MKIYVQLFLWTFVSLTKTNATLIGNVNLSLCCPRFPCAYVIFETQRKEFNSHGVTLVHQHVLHFFVLEVKMPWIAAPPKLKQFKSTYYFLWMFTHHGNLIVNSHIRYVLPWVMRLIWSQSHVTLLILGRSCVTHKPLPPFVFLCVEHVQDFWVDSELQI